MLHFIINSTVSSLAASLVAPMRGSFAHVIAAHPAISGAIAAWLIGNVAAALPSPDANSGKPYKFFFAFMHSVGGSIPRLGATLFPQYAKYFGASAIAPGTRNP